MTGFGRASVRTNQYEFTVEIKSLNSKQLDLSIRVPASLRRMEVELRSEVSPTLQRGKVEITAGVEHIDAQAPVELNMKVLEDYREQILGMSRQFNLPEPSDWYATLLKMPEAYATRRKETETEDQCREETEAMTRAVNIALQELVVFRKKEGARLEEFFRTKIANIAALLKDVEPYEKERITKVRKRLEEQLALIDTPEYNSERLEQEMIFYIEKLDITEEKIRLATHLDYFLATLSLPEAGQGKKLGFIAQEMGREINTLGSKANHAEIQRIVVRMKDELEQIKEQVLNVL